MIIHKPEKQRHYYLSQIQTKKKKNVDVRFDDAKIVSITELPKDAGYLLHLWLPPDNQVIKQLEQDVFEAVCTHQNEWFQSDLSIEKLSEYFCSCSDANNVYQVTVSSIKTPRVYFNNDEIEDFSDIASKNIRDIRKSFCRGTLEVSGLFFYQQKFGIKLVLRNLHIGGSNVATLEEVNPYKLEVESEWHTELEDFSELLQKDEQEIRSKIQRISELKTYAHDLLTKAKQETECTKEWNETLETLRSLIFRYRTGSLL